MIGSTLRSDRRRRSAGRLLIADAVVVGLAGLATAAFAATVAAWLGRGDVDLVRAGGGVLLIYALLFGGHVMKRGASRWSLGFSVLVNTVWVAASAAALLDVLPGFEDARPLLVIAQGALVGLFAVWQARAIRAMR